MVGRKNIDLSRDANPTAKVRSKVRAIDGIKSIVTTLNNTLNVGKDAQLITNAVDCISSLAEDRTYSRECALLTCFSR